MIIYEVKISRKFKKSKVERLMEGEFWWDVDATVHGTYTTELSDFGWARSLQKAKAKALRHILNAESKIGEGEEYGVMIKVQGTAEEVREVLK